MPKNRWGIFGRTLYSPLKRP